MRPDTLAVHAGREDFDRCCVHAPPIDLSSTYPLGDLAGAAEAFDALSRGEAPADANPVYQRLANPTVRRYERALAALEHTEDAVAFASGMAALTAVLLATCTKRRHVVAIRPLYGGSDHLLACGLLGIDVTWATPAGIADAVGPDTGLVILETPQNPTLGTVDIRAAATAAGDVPVLVDNTFATPILQNPADAGAAYVLHSATKYLGGHGDVVAGIVATTAARAGQLRQVRILTGALLHPLGAYLLHRSLPTLPFRVREAQSRAQTLAALLKSHPAVECVLYPEADGVQLRGPGSILSFEVRGGLQAASSVMGAVRLITPAVSLGSTDSLIQHPASLTHRLVAPEAKAAAGITDGLLRVSVGLEDVEDLWEDLSSALDRAVPRPRRHPRRAARARAGRQSAPRRTPARR